MIDDENNPEHWKFGIFYFNPEDKRLIVPKRIKAFGLTLNFANPYAILWFVGTLIFLAILGKLK